MIDMEKMWDGEVEKYSTELDSAEEADQLAAEILSASHQVTVKD